MEQNTAIREHQYVLFKLDDEYYAIDILQVETIEKVINITRVPHALEYVQGVINLRGDVIPVVNLRKRFQLPESSYDDNSRIIIVSIEDVTVGLMVDSSSEVLPLAEEFIDDASSIMDSTGNKFIKGIGKHQDRIIIILDLRKVLNIKEMSDDLE